MPGLTAASISENPLHKGTITQQSSAGRVFKGLGVAKRGHLTKRKESYAKSHPNGRSWLTTALSPRIILLCPVEAYPSLTSGLAEDLQEQVESLAEDYREIAAVLSGG